MPPIIGVRQLDGQVQITVKVDYADGDEFTYAPRWPLIPYGFVPIDYLVICLGCGRTNCDCEVGLTQYITYGDPG